VSGCDFPARGRICYLRFYYTSPTVYGGIQGCRDLSVLSHAPSSVCHIATGSGRNGNEAVTGAASEAFARWLHRRYAPSICYRRGTLVTQRDVLSTSVCLFLSHCASLAHCRGINVFMAVDDDDNDE